LAASDDRSPRARVILDDSNSNHRSGHRGAVPRPGLGRFDALYQLPGARIRPVLRRVRAVLTGRGMPRGMDRAEALSILSRFARTSQGLGAVVAPVAR
jgi:hypothetical protein